MIHIYVPTLINIYRPTSIHTYSLVMRTGRSTAVDETKLRIASVTIDT